MVLDEIFNTFANQDPSQSRTDVHKCRWGRVRRCVCRAVKTPRSPFRVAPELRHSPPGGGRQRLSLRHGERLRPQRVLQGGAAAGADPGVAGAGDRHRLRAAGHAGRHHRLQVGGGGGGQPVPPPPIPLLVVVLVVVVGPCQELQTYWKRSVEREIEGLKKCNSAVPTRFLCFFLLWGGKKPKGCDRVCLSKHVGQSVLPSVVDRKATVTAGRYQWEAWFGVALWQAWPVNSLCVCCLCPRHMAELAVQNIRLNGLARVWGNAFSWKRGRPSKLLLQFSKPNAVLPALFRLFGNTPKGMFSSVVCHVCHLQKLCTCLLYGFPNSTSIHPTRWEWGVESGSGIKGGIW